MGPKPPPLGLSKETPAKGLGSGSSTTSPSVTPTGKVPVPVPVLVERLLAKIGHVPTEVPGLDVVMEYLSDVSTIRNEFIAEVNAKSRVSKSDSQALIDCVEKFPALVYSMASAMLNLYSRNKELESSFNPDIMSLLDSIRVDVQDVKSRIAEPVVVQATAEHSPPPPVPKPRRIGMTYASALASPSPPLKDIGVVEVSPSEASEGLATALEVKSALQAAVKPSELGWQVVGVRSKGKKVELTVAGVDAARRVVENAALAGAGLTARVVDKRKPRITVYDVPRDVDPPALLVAIKSQNFAGVAGLEGSSWGSFSHEFGRRDAATRNVVLRVDPTVRDLCVKRGRLFVGWRSCRVVDFVGVIRCWKCHDYGHVRKVCNREETCLHCAAPGHHKVDCPDIQLPPRCPACTFAKAPNGHSMDAIDECATYCRFFRRSVERTQYD